MVCRTCSEMFAGRRRAAMNRRMPAMAVAEGRRRVGRREWPARAGDGDEVGWRVVMSPAAFVELVRRLVFRKARGLSVSTQ